MPPSFPEDFSGFNAMEPRHNAPHHLATWSPSGSVLDGCHGVIAAVWFSCAVQLRLASLPLMLWSMKLSLIQCFLKLRLRLQCARQLNRQHRSPWGSPLNTIRGENVCLMVRHRPQSLLSGRCNFYSHVVKSRHSWLLATPPGRPHNPPGF